MKPKEKAALFRKLHDRARLLVLPNAWDAASARVFEEAGFPAIATTSAGIAASLGYPDGERISRGEMAKAVARIAKAVRVPVSADFEAGYGPIPKAVRQTVEAALEAGAVGMNLEDATGDRVRPLFDPEVQAERIRAARDAAGDAGFFINARTDVYLLEVGAEAARFDRTVRRAKAYLEAGADGIFVPGVADRELIGRLAKAVDAPLNVLAGPGTPPAAELQALGVARLSIGSGAMRASLGLTRRIARELLDAGTYGLLTEGAIPYAEVNELLDR
jgi:2-methylisocitrate lyase-like PEP mutase family enzyme